MALSSITFLVTTVQLDSAYIPEPHVMFACYLYLPHNPV